MGNIIQVDFPNKKKVIDPVPSKKEDKPEIIFDEDGFLDVPVIVQDLGLLGEDQPPELCIVGLAVYGNDEHNKQHVAELNEATNLSFSLATAKIKILPGMKEWTPQLLTEEMTKNLLGGDTKLTNDE